MQDLFRGAWFRFVAHLMIVTTLTLGFPISQARAGMLGTETVVSTEQLANQRERIHQFLDRAEVRAQLQSLGVDAALAQSRVDALTAQEVAQINGKLDQMPAGGVDALVVILVVFLILLLTDILGFTQIFPFIKPVR